MDVGGVIADCEVTRIREHRVEHRLGEPSGERVLLARVVAAQEDDPARVHPIKVDLSAVAKPRSRLWDHPPASRERGKCCGPSETAERDHYPQFRLDEFEFTVEPGGARVALLQRRLVVRRGAMNRRGDAGGRQPLSIFTRDRTRGRGEADTVKGSKEPIAASVAGEHPPCAVCAVSSRGETNNEDRGSIGAETRDRRTPIGVIGVGRALDDRDILSPGDQPRTGAALFDRPIEFRW